ncbi:MAG: UDP-N-acetylmuramoylalanyl-D-glutamyl-2, 6-diaminopimelate-D-alanyl-D-alanine ligase MurF [Candidatus Giovannonibacteria bacterium GW2011_GWB1_45_9b]|uniref:UDP-N-acetylmuramoylalanyl-D-glutamyl-2, 6-diaminopimelate-D-alanyl-D-alanine ligase MurF n=1 Tax=Candidatus Giovannonibacteria bacterium GW2011_GWB1_45_9b TaxID=1618653 RepID=A0A0G1R4I2_9BACT|nr:MAG: UDP-N-acetylmuramoylalanyl-D-glutamyl-2, 6-diaminopimelate-D-alanyl-D-alanine ligase MurF [Candidatus Giovannonibacteria bacterium GW2011_GWB1_45_9b]
MREILKKIVVFVLTWEARLILKKYKAKIVAVTGSVGKTSTKDAIAKVLEKKFRVRKSKTRKVIIPSSACRSR